MNHNSLEGNVIMSIWSDMIDLYREKKGQIMLFAVIVVLPIQLAYWLLSNYFSILLTLSGLDFVAYLVNTFFILWFLSLIQIPFIYIGYQGYFYETLNSKRIIKDMLVNCFQIYVLGFIFALFVTVGFMFYIVPGLILMVLFLAFPYAVIIDKTKWWKTIKLSFQFGKSNFVKLLIFILLFGVIEWLLEMLLIAPLVLITSKFLYINLAFMLINILIISSSVFYLTWIYLKWKEETT